MSLYRNPIYKRSLRYLEKGHDSKDYYRIDSYHEKSSLFRKEKEGGPFLKNDKNDMGKHPVSGRIRVFDLEDE